MPAAVSFAAQAPEIAVDPHRMDVAMMVGFLPLAAGGRAARAGVAARLAAQGWGARADDTLTDLPVRLTSLEAAEALFDLDARPDRVARVWTDALGPQVVVPPDGRRVAVQDGGALRSVDLPAGPVARADLPALLAPLGVTVALGPVDAQGRAALVFSRRRIGGLTVFANPTLGLPNARADAVRATGCPMGAALRGFFASGGREVVVVPMGPPPRLYADAAERIAALGRLVGGGYGAGAADFAALAAVPLPGIAPAYPPRAPWQGLAHLHGLPDVAMVLMPDLSELVATTPGVAPRVVPLAAPAAVFGPCVPAGAPGLAGEALPGTPARADADGLAVWSRVVAWMGDQTARVTPEAMVLADLPPAGPGTGPATLPSHRQLQVVAPMVVSEAARGLPGRAMGGAAILAGAIAARTLARGAWATVAGQPLAAVAGLIADMPHPEPDRISRLGRRQGGFGILSDRGTDPGDFAQAAVRRLVALVLRAARHRGQAAAFEPNGPALWRDVAMGMRGVLRRLHAAGALAGTTEDAAFTLRCGPDTMSQADIDAGRVIATVGLLPTASLEHLEIVMIARGGDGGVA